MSESITRDPRAPVGVFDSGVGGLSVLRHARDLLPAESFIYVADSANLPYGDKTPAFIRERVLQLGGELVDMGAKALVVACNTATAAAVELLRERYRLPVIGMEPGVKPAVERSSSGVVGILATPSTVQSHRLATLVDRYAGEAMVLVQPCSGLVEQVERHALDTRETTDLLQHYLQPLIDQGADTLVLGCTHYPFLLPAIRRLVGKSVEVIDTGPAVARQLQRRLAETGLSAPANNVSRIRFLSTGSGLESLFARLWGEAVVVESLPADADKLEVASK